MVHTADAGLPYSSAVCLIRGGAHSRRRSPVLIRYLFNTRWCTQPTPLFWFSSVICLIRGGAHSRRRSPVLIGVCLIRGGAHDDSALSAHSSASSLLDDSSPVSDSLALAALWCPSPRRSGSLDHHVKQTLDFVLLLCPKKVPKLKFRFTWF